MEVVGSASGDVLNLQQDNVVHVVMPGMLHKAYGYSCCRFGGLLDCACYV